MQIQEPPATLKTEWLKRNEYRARRGPQRHKFRARHRVHTDILKDSSTPWAKGVDAADRSTNKGWAIRRYEGMQRAEGRTQSGLHFSCRGRPGSYWKYLHVIYGAHMLQEPNAPPSYLRRYPPSPTREFSSTFRARAPFPPLFLRLPPFFCIRRSAGNDVFRFPLSISHLLHPLPRQPLGSAGNVSRILQNVSRLSYRFCFLPTDETTNTRMDWIFDGADSSRPSIRTPSPSPSRDVRRYSCIESRAKRRQRRDDFLPIAISSGTRYRFEWSRRRKGCFLRNIEGWQCARCVHKIGRRTTIVIPRRRRVKSVCIARLPRHWGKKPVSFRVHFTTTNRTGKPPTVLLQYRSVNIHMICLPKYTRFFFPRKHFIKCHTFCSFLILNIDSANTHFPMTSWNLHQAEYTQNVPEFPQYMLFSVLWSWFFSWL